MKPPKNPQWVEGEKYDHPKGFPIICPDIIRGKGKECGLFCNFIDPYPRFNEDYEWIMIDFAELPVRTQNYLSNTNENLK